MTTLRPTRRSWTCLALALAVWLVPAAAMPQLPPAGSPAAAPVLATVVDVPAMESAAIMPPASTIQSEAAGLASLRQHLGRGDRVTLVRTDGRAVSGKIVRLGAIDLDLRSEVRDAGGRKRKLTLTIPLEEIESLDRRGDSAKNGALIGAGVGAGVGIALFAHAYAIDANEMDEWAGGYALGTLVTTGLGALIGWAVDAANTRPDFHYVRARPPVTRLQLVPMGSWGKGVAVVVAFR